jgi:hypothetical protein
MAGLLVLAGAVGGRAQQFETLGARALGMAGAFVAVADDATATYWNPAGLATGAFISLLIDRQSLEVRPDGAEPAAGRSANVFALSLPQVGLSYQRLRYTTVSPPPATDGLAIDRHTDDRPNVHLTSLIAHQTGLTVLQSLADGLVLGTTLKLVRGIAAEAPGEHGRRPADLLDQAAGLVGRAGNALDLDVGLMAGGQRARAGLVIRNLRRPEFGLPGEGALRLERQVRAGVALFPTRGLTLATDLDLLSVEAPQGARRNLAAGAEGAPGGRLLVRGGVRLSTMGEVRPAAAAGVSFAARPGLWIDAQVTRGQSDADSGWGVAMRLGF